VSKKQSTNKTNKQKTKTIKKKKAFFTPSKGLYKKLKLGMVAHALILLERLRSGGSWL
jgi:hypothetical protein